MSVLKLDFPVWFFGYLLLPSKLQLNLQPTMDEVNPLGHISKSVQQFKHYWIYRFAVRNMLAFGKINPNPMVQAGGMKKPDKRVLCTYKRGSDAFRCDTYLKSQLSEELVMQRPS